MKESFWRIYQAKIALDYQGSIRGSPSSAYDGKMAALSKKHNETRDFFAKIDIRSQRLSEQAELVDVLGVSGQFFRARGWRFISLMLCPA